MCVCVCVCDSYTSVNIDNYTLVAASTRVTKLVCHPSQSDFALWLTSINHFTVC